MKTNSSLTKINLSGDNGDVTVSFILLITENSIGDEGVKALADALKTNTSLSRIILGNENRNYNSNNKTGSEGTKALAEALKTNISLTKLDLSCGDG